VAEPASEAAALIPGPRPERIKNPKEQEKKTEEKEPEEPKDVHELEASQEKKI